MTYFHNSVIGTCKGGGWGSHNEGEGNTFAFNLKQHKRETGREKKIIEVSTNEKHVFHMEKPAGAFYNSDHTK